LLSQEGLKWTRRGTSVCSSIKSCSSQQQV